MSSLFGQLGSLGRGASLDAAAQRLTLAEHLRTTTLLDTVQLRVGAVDPAPRPAWGGYSEAGLCVAMAGEVVLDGRSVDAKGLATRFRREGLAGLRGGEGGHAICLLDDEEGAFHLFADPLGTTPLFWAMSAGHLAFAPDPLTTSLLLGSHPRMDRSAALEFLLNRYLVGSHTLVEGVHRLAPGECLRVSVPSMSVSVERYWDLKYRPELRSIDEAVGALDEALVTSHRRLFDGLGDSGHYQMFLTGGMDSRGILAYAGKLGVLPRLALTWGERDDVPGSDPVIARLLAEEAGAPFAFAAVDGAGWAEHADDWIRTSALYTDNGNSFAVPLNAFAPWSTPRADFVVLGDEMFGAGPLPDSPRAAIDNIMRTALRQPGGAVAQLLRPDSHAEALDGFNATLHGIVRAGPHDDPKDIQDHLFFHTYIANWILAPGIFKLPLLAARRPLMTVSVMDVVRRLSSVLRVDKSAFVHLMRARFPHVLRVPMTASDSGVDWGQACRQPGPLRRRLELLLKPDSLQRLPIGADLDPEGARSFLSRFFQMAPARAESPLRSRVRRMAYDLRRELSRSDRAGRALAHVQPLVLRALGQTGRAGQERQHQIVMRLAELVILQDQLEEMAMPSKQIATA